MKLVVGLGNPGRKYDGTRHNVGFEVVAELARTRAGGTGKLRFHGETDEVTVRGEKVLLLRPLTFMNLSGQSVGEACAFYKIEVTDLLVVCDDFQLPLGKLRFRARGTSGGQKGLTDILQRLGSDAVSRLRIGIGTPPPHWDPADFVLSRFHESEKSIVTEAVGRAAQGVEDWIEHGIAYCMNGYNAEKTTE